MLPERQRERWAEFYESARQNEYLDERTTLLLHLAAAMAGGCDP
jgi:hypothetical protein